VTASKLNMTLDASASRIIRVDDLHTHTTVLLLFWNLSRTTWVSRYQKGKTRKVKPIWIYWSKR